MGSKKGSTQTWVEYYLSFHLGYCIGPVDELTALFANDREFFRGSASGGKIAVDNPNLFGGIDREGGLQGDVYVLTGAEDQTLPPELAARFGLTPETAPGFRGVASLAFLGPTQNDGFKISANYPQVPVIKARFRRGSYTLPAVRPIIVNSYGYWDCNPAHILHEVITNGEWGMGAEPGMLDEASFVRAASTLSDEDFGLSLRWAQQATIESFVQEILDHIQGLLYFSPSSGLLTLKLLRKDYDPNALPELGPEDGVLKTFRRKLWGETVNEVVVSWTNPETEEEETVAFQDLANIAMQGEVVSETRNYHGIRSPELAVKVGNRDIVAAATPLASAEMLLDRRQWAIEPGDMVRINWPAHSIDRILMRVMEVDYGKPDNSQIKVTLVEDVFGTDYAQYISIPETEWTPPDQDPNSPEFIGLDAKFVAIPYPFVSTMVGAENVDDGDFPFIIIAALVTPTREQTDLQSFVLNEPTSDPTGAAGWIGAGEKNTVGMTGIVEGLDREVVSDVLIDMENVRGVSRPQVGRVGHIDNTLGGGDGLYMSEGQEELVLFLADLGNNLWRVARGVFDTIPHRWPAGSTIRFIDDSFDALDPTAEPAWSQVSYKLQPRTSLGLQDINLTPVTSTSRPARPYLPFRPANVRMDGLMFAGPDYSENYNPRDWAMLITWSTRHRKMEDAVYRRWDEGDVTPETGQTTEVCFWAAEPGGYEELERRVRGLTGSSYSIDIYGTGQVEAFPLKVVSMRSEMESLQGIEENVRLYKKGYGSDWGYFYGGWPNPGAPDDPWLGFTVGTPGQSGE
ncbi:phage tail protein [Amorphus orientalis]|uniref:Tip attachment protein J domain-containing protein n=1 Tax=Amorphus orientalis TaxID=649198 RepID=A0AAE4AWG0_9HYPH|nr:phage tail protein [Amorphus orientalis]MDQ0317729.1 hypothetical protein [Amorphus orientalis]